MDSSTDSLSCVAKVCFSQFDLVLMIRRFRSLLEEVVDLFISDRLL